MVVAVVDEAGGGSDDRPSRKRSQVMYMVRPPESVIAFFCPMATTKQTYAARGRCCQKASAVALSKGFKSTRCHRHSCITPERLLCLDVRAIGLWKRRVLYPFVQSRFQVPHLATTAAAAARRIAVPSWDVATTTPRDVATTWYVATTRCSGTVCVYSSRCLVVVQRGSRCVSSPCVVMSASIVS